MEKLKVGDYIKITSLPEGYLHPDTRRIYKKLIKRNKPLRIAFIQDGLPWYVCRFKKRNGKFEIHSLNVMDSENNYRRIK